MDKSTMMAEAKATVLMYARKYSSRRRADLDLDDLVSIGFEAALRALSGFREGRGATFGTYCRMPVETAIRNACKRGAWQGLMSLDAPVGEEDATFLDLKASAEGTPEEQFETAERTAQIRAAVARVSAEFAAHKEMAALLAERLSSGEMVESRFRSEGLSCRELGEMFGVSRQTVLNVEKRLRERLAEELADLEER